MKAQASTILLFTAAAILAVIGTALLFIPPAPAEQSRTSAPAPATAPTVPAPESAVPAPTASTVSPTAPTPEALESKLRAFLTAYYSASPTDPTATAWIDRTQLHTTPRYTAELRTQHAAADTSPPAATSTASIARIHWTTQTRTSWAAAVIYTLAAPGTPGASYDRIITLTPTADGWAVDGMHNQYGP